MPNAYIFYIRSSPVLVLPPNNFWLKPPSFDGPEGTYHPQKHGKETCHIKIVIFLAQRNKTLRSTAQTWKSPLLQFYTLYSMGSETGIFEKREQYTGLVGVKFHVHSTTTSEIIKLCEYCCLLYFSSLKLPLLPEHAGFVQAPLSCVSWALFSALLVLSPLHIKPTVYISMQKVAKRTLFLRSKHYCEHRTCRSSTRGTGKRALLQWQGC